MPRNPSFVPDDDLFRAIHAERARPRTPGEPALHALLQEARDTGRRWHEAYALAVLSIRLVRASHATALEMGEAALAHFEALDSDWGRSTALNALAGAVLQGGQMQRSLELYQASIALARRCNDPLLLMRSLLNTASALSTLEQHQTMVPLCEEALSLCREADVKNRADVSTNLATALVGWARQERTAGAAPTAWQPRVQRATELLRPHLQGTLPKGEHLRERAYAWGALAAAMVMQEQHLPARAIFALLEPHYAAMSDAHALLFVHRHLAWSHLQCGETDAAMERAQAHHALVVASGRAADEHAGLQIAALALEHAGRWQEALAAFKLFHEAHARNVLAHAEDKARALAVSSQTDRALRESRIDALTELANRRAFDAELARSVAEGHCMSQSLMLIDLDHFKRVNDSLGHAAGDEALRALAAALREQRRTGDLPARLGGDEFAVLVDADTDAAVRLAERVRHALRQWQPQLPFVASPTLTLSIGVAGCPAGAAASDWLAAADQALYAAKHAGRDAVRVHSVNQGPG